MNPIKFSLQGPVRAAIAVAIAVSGWLLTYSELSVGYGNAWWRLLAYAPAHALAAVAFIWLGEAALRRRPSWLAVVATLAMLILGWVVLYWLSLVLSLAMYWPASRVGILDFVPIGGIVEWECRNVALAGAAYFAGRAGVAMVRWGRNKARHTAHAA